MLSKNNFGEEERKITSNPNRFTLRKLNIGVCSVIAGLSFIGINAHADQVKDDQQPTQPTDQEQTSSSASQTLQTAQQVELHSASTASTATNQPGNDQQTQPKQQAHVNRQQEQPTQQSQPANAPVVLASTGDQQTTNQDPVNVNNWQYTRQSDGILLNGYNGTAQNGQYIVPNSYDFTQAGLIQNGQKVYLAKTLINQLANATQLMISHNGNGKVIAQGADWSGAFARNSSLQTVDLANLDVSQVTNMSQMFYNMWNLRQVKGLGTWDTRNVTNISQMFMMDAQLTTVEGLDQWNTSKVTDMSQVFTGCEALTSNLDLSHWQTGNVTTTSGMFSDTQLGINISGWDLTHDTDVSSMFANWTGFHAPSFINMMGVKMPTQTQFDKSCFALNQFDNNWQSFNHLIIYSDDPTILALNGQLKPNNQITVKTADGSINKTYSSSDFPDFVFAGSQKLLAAVQQLMNQAVTEKYGSGKSIASAMVANETVQKAADTNPIALFTGNIVLTLQGPAYTQQIVYLDQNNQQVAETTVNGHLNVNNQATISATSLNDAVQAKLPTGYYLVSQPLTDTTITIKVSNQSQVTFTYKTTDNQAVGTKTVTGTVGNVIDVPVPDNYALADTQPINYTVKPRAQQSVTVLVKHLTGTITVKYVDTDNNNHEVHVDHFSGDVGTAAHLTYQVPSGYDLDGQLPSKAFTYTKDDQTITIKLQHKAAQGEIQYIDTDENNKVVSSTPISGRQGVQQTLTFTIPDNYEAVGQLPSTSYTFTKAGTNDPIVIKLQHKAASVMVQYEDTDNDDHVVASKKFTGKVGLPTTLHFDVPANYDLISPLPTTSYTFAKAGANDPIVIQLKHKAASAVIHYVDGQNQVGSQTITGRVGVPVNLKLQVPTGYQVDGTTPTTYTFTADANQQVDVHVKKAAESVKVIFQDENDHQVGQGQTISGDFGQSVDLPDAPTGYTLVDGQSMTYTFTANANQQVILKVNHAAERVKVIFQDENNHQVGQGQTVSGKYDQTVTLPTAPAGYTLVDGQRTTYTLTDRANQQVIMKVAHAQETATVVFQDENGKNVETKMIDGKYGEQVTLPAAPAGYTLANGQPTTYTLMADANQQVTLKVNHAAESVQVVFKDESGQQVGESQTINGKFGEQVTLPAAPAGYTLVKGQSTTYTLTAAANQQVTLKVTQAQETATVVFQDENGQQVGETTVGGKNGQTVNLPSVPQGYILVNGQPSTYTLTNGTNQRVIIKVSHAAENVQVIFKDENGQNVVTKTVDGKYGEKITLPTAPAGYTLVDGQSNTYTLTAATNQQVILKVTHAAESVQVVFQDENGQQVGQTQTINGKYGEKVTLPSVPAGYTLVNDQPTTYTLTDGANQQAILKVTQAQETATVIFQDENGQQVGESQTINGKFGEQVALPAVPAGYTLVDGQPTTYTLTDGANQQIILKVTHAQETATIIFQDENGQQVGDSQTINGKFGEQVALPAAPAGYTLVDGQPTTYTLTDGTNQQIILKVTHAQETATIIFQDENGQQVGDSQTINGKFGEQVALPAAPAGYTLVDGQPTTYTLTDEDNQHVDVHVKKAAESVKVIFQDENGQQVGQTQTISGDFGQSIDLPAAPAGYTLINDQPTAYTLTFDANQQVILKVAHAQETATVVFQDENGQTVATQPANGKFGDTVTLSAPTGYTFTDGQTAMTYTLTANEGQQVIAHVTTAEETIQIVFRDENGHQIGKSQSLQYHYGDVLQLTFQKANVNVPVAYALFADAQDIPVTITLPVGYELAAGQPSTINYQVTADGDQSLSIRLQKAAASVQVIYQTIDGQQIKTDTVHGRIGDQVNLNIALPAGYEAVGQLPSGTYTLTGNDQPIVITVKAHQAQRPDHSQSTTDHGQTVTPTTDHDQHQDQQSTKTTLVSPTSMSQGTAASQLTNVQTSTHSTTNKQAKKLPQTGDHHSAALLALGGTALMLALGLTTRIHRHE